MIGVQIDRIIKRQSSFHPSSLTDISKLKSQVVDLNPGSSLSCCKSLMLYLKAIAFLSFHFTCWKDISVLPRDTDLANCIQKETAFCFELSLYFNSSSLSLIFSYLQNVSLNTTFNLDFDRQNKCTSFHFRLSHKTGFPISVLTLQKT